MADTIELLEQARDLLRTEIPDSPRAVTLVSEIEAAIAADGLERARRARAEAAKPLKVI